MFDSIKDLLRAVSGTFDTKEREQVDQCLMGLGVSDQLSLELAAMVIVVSLATIDNEFAQEEYQYIFSEFKKRFNLGDDEIIRLVKQVELMIVSHGGSSIIMEHIKASFPIEQRQSLYELVKGIISADGVEHGFEKYLNGTYKQYLGLL